jgi:hypothetical protein
MGSCCVIMLNIWQVLPMSFSLSSSSKWFVPNGIRIESALKKAAVKKTDQMVENARALHNRRDSDSAVKSFLGQALLNHTETETVGGIWWAWKRIWSFAIFENEGMWYPNRLVSINVTQFVMAILILFVGGAGTVLVSQNYAPPETAFETVLNQLFNIDIDLEKVLDVTRSVSSTVANFLVQDTPVESFGCLNRRSSRLQRL